MKKEINDLFIKINKLPEQDKLDLYYYIMHQFDKKIIRYDYIGIDNINNYLSEHHKNLKDLNYYIMESLNEYVAIDYTDILQYYYDIIYNND